MGDRRRLTVMLDSTLATSLGLALLHSQAAHQLTMLPSVWPDPRRLPLSLGGIHTCNEAHEPIATIFQIL
jgi:hypothetical protein